MLSEVAMVGLKKIAAPNCFQNIGTNASSGAQNSTDQPNRPLQRSINGSSRRCFLILGASRRS